KLAASQRVADLREMETWFKQWRKSWAGVEAGARRSHGPVMSPAELGRLLDFCQWNQEAIRALEGRLAQMGRTAQYEREMVGKSIDSLLDNAKKLLLLPFATISASFPKLVRDLCRAEGKEADLLITGE